ncbi:MAG: hypothetical protein JWO03_561 [Bacteroidetes bacterium]|nr:hypothetical protein [Bacteroidota bacterium]
MSNNLSLAAAKVSGSPLDMQHKQARSITSTTVPYTGQWTRKEAVHLLKRTMFSCTQADVDHMLTLTVDQAVNELLNNSTITPAPPLNNYGTTANPDPNIPFGATWVNDTTVSTLNAGRKKSLQEWYTSNMLAQGISLEQKMTLFWHNHFSTELNVYNDARAGYKYIEIIRSNALGNFRTLVKAISIDPAMLNYLNGYVNTKNAPDENYGRELQELFTVGKGPNSLYTQADVEAAARVLTGYRITSSTMTSYFDTTKHDTNAKQFSAFYNNTIINNTGNGGADELDDLLNMILATNECAMYLARRLYRFFVYYDIDTTIETNIITPMAAAIRNNNYDIKPALSLLFKSEHFFDTLNMGCFIKPPVDFFVGMMRQMGVVFPDNTDLATQYYMWGYLEGFSALCAQDLLNPPNVAGWPAYYQIPEYHELWINSNTLPNRNAFADMMINTGYTRAGKKIIIDTLAFTATMPTPDDPVALVDDVLSLLLSIDVDQTVKDYLKSILLSGQSSNSYWTTAWTDYAGTPGNTGYQNTVTTRLKPFYQYIMDLPEYQLQ